MAKIPLWGILLLVRGSLELVSAPTNPCYHHIDAAYIDAAYIDAPYIINSLTPFVSA